jgi:hypothetical protein
MNASVRFELPTGVAFGVVVGVSLADMIHNVETRVAKRVRLTTELSSTQWFYM